MENREDKNWVREYRDSNRGATLPIPHCQVSMHSRSLSDNHAERGLSHSATGYRDNTPELPGFHLFCLHEFVQVQTNLKWPRQSMYLYTQCPSLTQEWSPRVGSTAEVSPASPVPTLPHRVLNITPASCFSRSSISSWHPPFQSFPHPLS